jgi:plastocyanin
MRVSIVALFCLALFASGCGTSSPTSPSNPGDGSLVTVFINNSTYSPNPVTVNVGQQVNWKNNDNIAHTATREGMFDNRIAPMSAQGAPVTMTTKGTFTYHCTIHPGMTGTIIVQ